MKTYIIKIEADGINHHQAIFDEDDLDILMAVLDKIKRDAGKVSKPLDIEALDRKFYEELTVKVDEDSYRWKSQNPDVVKNWIVNNIIKI